jgi:hypothetical protein
MGMAIGEPFGRRIANRERQMPPRDAPFGIDRGEFFRLALVGVAVVIAFTHSQLLNTLSEYVTFYIGGRLVGTPYLYDMAHGYREQIRALGGYGDQFLFVRLPFVALLHAPLALLPYGAAAAVWGALSVGALAAFVRLWPAKDWRWTLAACCWSSPVAFDFVFGKDTVALVLLLAVAVRIHDERPVAAGLVLSLLAIKYHLFFPLPMLVIAQRRWKTGAGFLAGAAVLAAVSFLAGGWDWPARLLELRAAQTSPNEYLMPNLRGMLEPFTNSLAPELLLDAAAAAGVWWIARRADFRYGLAAVLVGGLLVSHHAALYDCVVLIPALLIVAERSGVEGAWKALNRLCLFLLTPLPYAMIAFGRAPGTVTRLSLIALLACMCLQARAPRPRTLAAPAASR